MLKHILTGQPSSAGSRHHNDYQSQNQQQLPQQQHQQQQQQQQQAQQQAPVGTTVVQTTSGGSSSLHHHHHHPGHLHSELQHHQHFTAASPSTRMPVTNASRLGSDVYDSVVHPSQRMSNNGQSHQPTPSSTHRHPLNQSQLSVNNLSQRLNHSHALNLSTLSTSKHSVNSSSPVVGNNNNNINNINNNNNNTNLNNNLNLNNTTSSNAVHQALGHATTQVGHERERSQANGGLEISRVSRLPSQTTPSPAPVPVHAPVSHVSQLVQPPGTHGLVHLNTSWSSSLSKNNKTGLPPPPPPPPPGAHQQEAGVKEMLTFLGLLCLVSLLLAMLSHIFLLKISPLTVTPSSLISPEEYTVVYEVTLALCALALSLNLCCLLVCAIQFLFAVKLVKSSYQSHRTNKYLQKSSISRVCAVGGFFVSIPVFLTGMILYTFIQFHSTPAIVMSVFIGLGIVFCGCAMVHNVFVWQREKTNAVKALARAQCEAAAQLQRQQQLQQQQQQQQPGGRGTTTMHRGGCAALPKIGTLTVGHSTATLQHARGSSAGHQSHNHNHHHHHQHQHRHVQMSPTLLLSSSSGLAAIHNHTGTTAPGHHRILATPPTTPGDRSPPSPSNKHNRSQHVQREASGSVSPGLPQATLDLSSAATTNSPHELSTLV